MKQLELFLNLLTTIVYLFVSYKSIEFLQYYISNIYVSSILIFTFFVMIVIMFVMFFMSSYNLNSNYDIGSKNIKKKEKSSRYLIITGFLFIILYLIVTILNIYTTHNLFIYDFKFNTFMKFLLYITTLNFHYNIIKSIFLKK